METVQQETLSINKSDWTKVKFGDVVFEPKESSRNPIADGIEHVVGLEHIESENIHLRNSKSLEEETTFTKRFSVGDVLFGRRRAYLKKAAQASFGGICSGDITVFRAKENLLPELLPFIVNNEKFFDYAVKHSAGGLSPRVKFKDLAKYEFLLPPKDQQAQLAELLWAMDEVVEKNLSVTLKLQQFYESKREELLNGTIKGDKVKLGDITKLQGGATFKSKDLQNKGVKWLKIANVGFHMVKWEIKEYLPADFVNQYPEYVLKEGDIVLALTRPILGDRLKVAQIGIKDLGSLLNQRVGRIKIKNDSILPNYLYEHLKSTSFMLAMKRELQGTDPPNISNKMYENYEIILPSPQRQQKVTVKLLSIHRNYQRSNDNFTCSHALQKSLINQIF